MTRLTAPSALLRPSNGDRACLASAGGCILEPVRSPRQRPGPSATVLVTPSGTQASQASALLPGSASAGHRPAQSCRPVALPQVRSGQTDLCAGPPTPLPSHPLPIPAANPPFQNGFRCARPTHRSPNTAPPCYPTLIIPPAVTFKVAAPANAGDRRDRLVPSCTVKCRSSP